MMIDHPICDDLIFLHSLKQGSVVTLRCICSSERQRRADLVRGERCEARFQREDGKWYVARLGTPDVGSDMPSVKRSSAILGEVWRQQRQVRHVEATGILPQPPDRAFCKYCGACKLSTDTSRSFKMRICILVVPLLVVSSSAYAQSQNSAQPGLGYVAAQVETENRNHLSTQAANAPNASCAKAMASGCATPASGGKLKPNFAKAEEQPR